jgi:hypothetical protein
VPELVGHVAHDLGVLAAGDFAVHLDVGDVGKLRILETVRAALELAQAQVQRTEGLGKGDLLVLAQGLVAPHEHRVRVHRVLDLLDLFGVSGWRRSMPLACAAKGCRGFSRRAILSLSFTRS